MRGTDRTTAYVALTKARLRRRIAARSPVRGPVPSLVEVLRAARDPFESEAALAAATRDGETPPWADLLAAHREQPWPEHVLCVVAERPDLPAGASTGRACSPMRRSWRWPGR
ncbi:hypothetical protein MF672_015570 [Actinomadura sp. ATCC 31491]|uniref:Uncharacterized protein n=1 Tax=Actinomadura luzonensis TaxID=2805427 RepID=A0ABT0FS93_9ACTN|nr:hypothetical protein [Actinomadura luzonensis]MCK2215195.1 hypothetical protein [Actinomadura luzonensis]